MSARINCGVYGRYWPDSMLPRHPADMDLAGLRLHPMKGDLQGFWAVDVSGNWRVIFRFDGEDPCDVDLTDYH